MTSTLAKHSSTYIKRFCTHATIPTRVNDKSSTVINHIVSNNTLRTIRPAGVIQNNNISDHYPVLCKIIGRKKQIESRRIFTIYINLIFNVDKLCEELDVNIFEFIASTDEITKISFDHQFDAFASVIQKSIDKYAPLKRFSRKK